MAGHEEPFPEPDNQSKMKRSCENAEHVGECPCHLGGDLGCATNFFDFKASLLPTLASTFEMSSAAADLSKSISVPIPGEWYFGKADNSRYDRGTRLAALEECSEFDMYPQQLVH